MLTEWHKWFAWRPVRLGRFEGTGPVVWLAWVERRYEPGPLNRYYGVRDWQYRFES